MPMEKSEIEYFASLLLEKERDIVVYEQAMVNFIAMLRGSRRDPAVLLHGSKTADDLIDIVCREIAKALSAVREERKSSVDDMLDACRKMSEDGISKFTGKENV